MSLWTARHSYVLHRLFRPFSDIENAAVSLNLLCPEESTIGDPAIFLDGQLDKVTGVQEETTLEFELERIKGGLRIHAPTVAHHIEDVTLLDGSLYKGRHKRSIVRRGTVDFSDPEPKHLDMAVLVSSYVGAKYFGHWLRDDCATYLLAKNYGVPLAIRTPYWPDKAAYAQIFQQNWTPTDRATINRLTVFSDYSQNSLKRQRYQALRTSVRRRFQARNPGGIVFLIRGRTGASRLLENEADIAELMEKRGVSTIRIGLDPLDKLIDTLLDASIVITVEGSQQDHAMLCIDDAGAVITLLPPYRFNNMPKDWTECLGMKYGFVVGDESACGFTIDPDDLMRTLDLVVERI